MASFYTEEENGQYTASGEIFDETKFTCATLTEQYGAYCFVWRYRTGHFTICRLTDHGPHIEGRFIDLSKAAMKQLNGIDKGLVDVFVLTFDLPKLKRTLCE